MPGPVTGVLLVATLLLLGLLAGGTFVAGRPRRAVAGARPGVAAYLRRRVDPAEATGLALTVALALLVLAALAFGLVADMIASKTGLARDDAAAAAWGARHATAASTRLLRWGTQLGSTVVVVGLALVTGLAEWLRRRRLAALGFLLTVVVGQNLAANAVKLVFHRERPPVAAHLVAATGFSFPSGHSAAAAATYAALALVVGRGRRWPVRALLGVAAAALTAAVAASRVLLGVHWLTDVAGGVALGLGWFLVCAVAFGGRMLRFGAPVEAAEASPRPAVGSPPPARPSTGSPMTDQEPSEEQVHARAAELPEELGVEVDDPDAQARALLEESEARLEDPAARDPDDPGVIRRTADEGVLPEE